MRFKKQCPEGVSYPLTKEQIVGTKQAIHSPTFPEDKRVLIDPSTIAKPSYPEDGDIFWSELAEVAIRVEIAKRKTRIGAVPKDLDDALMPKVLRGGKFISRTFEKKLGVRTYFDGAQEVKADWPTHILKNLAELLLGDGAKIRRIFKKDFEATEFTDGVVLFSRLLAKVIHEVSPTAFAVKWYYGRPRPEEAANAWAKGEFEVSPFMNTILNKHINKEAVAKNALNFPVYQCPLHPSYPAMHASLSGLSIIFGILFELTESQLMEVKRTAANIALFRDYGGVHYRTDSLVGLDIGEKIIADNLYTYLEYFAEQAGHELALSREEVEDSSSKLINNWSA